jgi:hypothetical protein
MIEPVVFGRDLATPLNTRRVCPATFAGAALLDALSDISVFGIMFMLPIIHAKRIDTGQQLRQRASAGYDLAQRVRVSC